MKRTLVAALLILLSDITPAAAGETIVVAGAFVDSSVAAPYLQLRTERGRDEYRFGISGWTIEGSWVRKLSPSRALLFSADATPFNAHSSEYIYVDGERASNLEYENASYRIKGGLRLTHDARSHTDVQLVALSEQLGEEVDPSLARQWNEPYAGVDVAYAYSHRTNENPLVSAWDGLELGLRGEAYSGQETWSRFTATEAAARTRGRLHFRQSITLMAGDSLTIVNRFLVGGSWDALGPTALYGLRYAEYRVDRALVASGGIDYLLPRHWRVGLRASCMRSNVENLCGQAINASTTWKTVGVNMGVGLSPDHDPTLYVAVVAPLYRRVR